MTKDARIRYTLRMPQALLEQLKELATQKGISVNALVLDVLWDWVEKSK